MDQIQRVWTGACAVIVLAALPSIAPAQETLVFNQFMPATSVWVKEMLEPWARDVERESGGRLKVSFTSGTLGPPPRQFDMVQKGIVDVAWFLNAFEAQRLVLHQIAELPRPVERGEAAAVALWRTHQKFFESIDEYKGVKLLSVTVSPAKNLHIGKRPVNAVADLKGLKLHLPPILALKLLERLGATPVVGPSAASYEAMSGGVVDGTFAEASTVADFKATKFVKYATYFPGSVSSVSFALIMNQGKWNRMPAADKDAIMRASGESFARRSRAWDQREYAARKELVAEGVTVQQASQAFLKEVAPAFEGLEKDWLARAGAKGIDAPAARRSFIEELGRVKVDP